MAAVILALIGGLSLIARQGDKREIREARLVLSAASTRSTDDLWDCLADERLDGLVLSANKGRGWFESPNWLVNSARHTTVRIVDDGQRRAVGLWIRRDLRLRAGEIRHWQSCIS